jgi:serine protease
VSGNANPLGPWYRPSALLFFALAFAFSIVHTANGARFSSQSATVAGAAITVETRSISRLIVTFADPELARASRANAKLGAEHDALLTKAVGTPAHVVRAMTGGAWVVELMLPVEASIAVAITQGLEQSGIAAMAAPDYPLGPLLTPNDSYFRSGDQWYLTATASLKGIDTVHAWDITTGDAGMVIAVVDSGIASHPEFAGRTVPGYDFVSDVTSANDGDGFDADASDPGDGRTAGVCSAPFATAANSNWHGTFIAGVIGATSNNGAGIAGVNWNARIQPVRVLGRCGATTSNVLDGASWAAGLPVPGVSPNPTPARVINISIGGKGACLPQYQVIFDQIVAAGAFVAVPAGNDNADAGAYSPASCAGVSTVVATNLIGLRASYSNFSIGADISAPGGDISRSGNSDAIVSTSNSGNLDSASPAYRAGDGTSFATALVSGVASLMLAVNPNLTPGQLKQLMAQSAAPFPLGSDCLTGICGAGIVNAFAAVKAAQGALLDPVPSEVVEFYNVALDHYFISANAQEIHDVDTGIHAGWQRTGFSFSAYLASVAGSNPVCRFYIPPANGDSHFFSASPTECAQTHAKFPSFIYEAPDVFYIALPDATTGICPSGTAAVYRVFDNRVDANHRYTTLTTVVDQMKAKGWIAEGYGPGPYYPIMCAPR